MNTTTNTNLAALSTEELKAELARREAATTGPQVGDGATRRVGSDCYPYTIIEVGSDAKFIRVQADSYKVVEGNFMQGNAVVEYSPNPEGDIITYTLRKNGKYIQQGAPMNMGGVSIGINGRRYYQDPSF